MTGIARFVQDKDPKKILRATDGLGTEATRAGLLNCCSLGSDQKRALYPPTDAGKALFHSLPEMATRPDMTAHWESVLTQISEKQCRYQDFMQPLVGTLYQLIDQAKRTSGKGSSGNNGSPAVEKGRKGFATQESAEKPAIRRGGQWSDNIKVLSTI